MKRKKKKTCLSKTSIERNSKRIYQKLKTKKRRKKNMKRTPIPIKKITIVKTNQREKLLSLLITIMLKMQMMEKNLSRLKPCLMRCD